MAFDLKTHPIDVQSLAADFENWTLTEILRWCWEKFNIRAGIGTSFQGAGIVIMDHAFKAGLRFPVFTLDTGLLFTETLELKARLEKRFQITIEGLVPDQTVEQQAAELGPELWKRNPDLCCSLRKVLPLQKKLAELDVWITGLRRDQSTTRTSTKLLELYRFDVLREKYILKLNPVANWSRDAIWQHIRANQLPYNPLTDKGYKSIGCIPCTRPIAEGDNERAGRWIGFDKSECGIHTFLGDNI